MWLSVLAPDSSNLQVVLDEVQFFLRPSPEPEVVPTEDPVISGAVHVHLAKPKKIKRITVKLLRFYSITFPDGRFEAGHDTVSEVSVCSHNEHEKLFASGDHAFAFNLIVPASAAPFERCPFGRMYHMVTAVAEGEGFLNLNLEAKQPVILTATPASDGETADLNMRVEGHSDQIGPYAIATAAQHFTVGGIINFDILLASAPHDVEILSLQATLNGKYTFRSVEEPSRKEQYSTERNILFQVFPQQKEREDTEFTAMDSTGKLVISDTSARNLAAIPAGGSFSFRHLARMPNDYVVRPSTLEGTQTPISRKHSLLVDVRFRDAGNPSAKVLTLRSETPIVVASCCCMLPSLLVPAYAEALDTPAVTVEQMLKNSAAYMLSYNSCVCGQSKDELIRLQRLAEGNFASQARSCGSCAPHSPGESVMEANAAIPLGLVRDADMRTRIDGLRRKHEYAPVQVET